MVRLTTENRKEAMLGLFLQNKGWRVDLLCSRSIDCPKKTQLTEMIVPEKLLFLPIICDHKMNPSMKMSGSRIYEPTLMSEYYTFKLIASERHV